MEQPLNITMLGNFRIAAPGSDSRQELSLSGRSRRIWTLVAYLILHRDRGVPVQELIDLLWPNGDSDDPLSTLQNNVSRARNALAKLGIPEAKGLIAHKDGLYRWNGAVCTDYDRFEQAAQRFLEQPADSREMEAGMAAVRLYTGDLLPEAATELWCVSVHMYYRNLYTRLCSATVKLLMEAGRYDAAEEICYSAFTRNPMEETFTIHLMRCLTMNGKASRALEIYRKVKQLYAETYGIAPSPELELERSMAERELYDRELDSGDLMLLLAGLNAEKGAFLCDSRVFCSIVNLHAREIARSHNPAQIGLLHLTKGSHSPEQQAIVMKQMEQTLSTSLRAGDPFARLGVNQFAVLLPGATPENGCMVVNRILSSFRRAYPGQSACFRCSVVDLASLREKNNRVIRV